MHKAQGWKVDARQGSLKRGFPRPWVPQTLGSSDLGFPRLWDPQTGGGDSSIFYTMVAPFVYFFAQAKALI